jgi:hypothetical protein
MSFPLSRQFYNFAKFSGVTFSVCVIGYEHAPAKIELLPLVDAFEAIAQYVFKFRLAKRVETSQTGLAHPVHQTVRIFGWEVLA